MPSQSENRRQRPRAARMFETRSQSWREAGLLRQISPRAVRRARFEALLLLPLFIGIVIVNDHRKELLGKGLRELEVPIQVVSVILLMILGWVIARSVGRAFGPVLFRRLEPATAGPVGFLIRLLTVAVTLVVALRIAGVTGKTLALGGAFTAVIVGLAAQQTLGNVIAGTMLLSTRPFRVGDRVLLQAGMLGGQVDGVSGRVEGVVSSLGLFYTTFVTDDATILIPNGVVMSVLVILGEDARSTESQQHNGAGGASAHVPGEARAAAPSGAARVPGEARAAAPSGAAHVPGEARAAAPSGAARVSGEALSHAGSAGAESDLEPDDAGAPASGRARRGSYPAPPKPPPPTA